MIDRLATPRGIAIAIAAIGLLIAASIGLGAWALVNQRQTDRQVREIAQRVVLIEQPATEAQRQRGIRQAVRELAPSEARELLNRLLRDATPAQRRVLRDIARAEQRTSTTPEATPSRPRRQGTTTGAAVPPATGAPPASVPSVPVVPETSRPSVPLPTTSVPAVPVPTVRAPVPDVPEVREVPRPNVTVPLPSPLPTVTVCTPIAGINCDKDLATPTP